MRTWCNTSHDVAFEVDCGSQLPNIIAVGPLIQQNRIVSGFALASGAGRSMVNRQSLEFQIDEG